MYITEDFDAAAEVQRLNEIRRARRKQCVTRRSRLDKHGFELIRLYQEGATFSALALAPLEGTEQAGGQTVRRVVPDVAEAVLVLRLHHGAPLLLRCLSSTAGLSTPPSCRLNHRSANGAP